MNLKKRVMAASIYNGQGKIIAAIRATVPEQRMERWRMPEIMKQILETARLISEQISIRRLGD
jgi:DNA-binding IclR family transcriptional regulator